MIRHYWFLNHGIEFQDSVCNLTMLSVNISDIAIITVKKNVDSLFIIHNVGKSEAITL